MKLATQDPNREQKGTQSTKPTPPTRRAFLRQAAGLGVSVGAVSLTLSGLMAHLTRPILPEGQHSRDLGLLRPPGALDESEFLATCIRCDRCRDACDARAIKIFGAEEGRQAGTPYIVARDHACDLCLLCTEACPTGALQKIEEKEQVRMGRAVVDKRLCVSWNGTGACGACHTICPLKNRAIRQELYNRPVVNPESCVGCGLCEEACIVKDRKAIEIFSGRPWA